MADEVILTINPGSTSTKLGLFNREGSVQVETVNHLGTPIAHMHSIIDQLPRRLKIISKTVQPWLEDQKLVAVVGRGGLIGPVKSGVYRVNEALKDVTLGCHFGSHASNLGASLAANLASPYGIPAFVVDPVSVDELIPEARLSGVPEIERRSRLHALNINACAQNMADKLGKPLSETRFIVAHLGGGISVAASDRGHIIDCNDALMGMGPFSPERAGALPLDGLVKLAMSEVHNYDELYRKLTKNSGLKGYLGTSDVKTILQRIDNGDEQADLVFRAMIYQIAKEIGAMATTMKGRIDRIIITGGMARSERVVHLIRERVEFIAPLAVFPGENELESMASGGFRAIDGLTEIRTYVKPKLHR